MNGSISCVLPFSERRIQALCPAAVSSHSACSPQHPFPHKPSGHWTVSGHWNSWQRWMLWPLLPSCSLFLQFPAPGFFNFLNSPFFPSVQTVDLFLVLRVVFTGPLADSLLFPCCFWWWCTTAKTLLRTTREGFSVQRLEFKFQSNSVTREKREDMSKCVLCMFMCAGVCLRVHVLYVCL